MAFLSAVHAAAFTAAFGFFFLGKFLETGIWISWGKVGKGNGRIIWFIGVRGSNVRATGVVARGSGGSGVIHVPSLIKIFGKVNKAGHGGRCRVDPKDLAMKRGRDILAKGVHFGFLIGLGA